jgi:hypothetical protein
VELHIQADAPGRQATPEPERHFIARLRSLVETLQREGWPPSEARRLAARLICPADQADEVAARQQWMRGPAGRPTPLETLVPLRPVAALDVLRAEAWSRADKLLDGWLPLTCAGGPLPARSTRTRPGWGRRYTVDLLAPRPGLGRFDWSEEATRSSGNDMITLAAHLAGVSWRVAADRLARMVGMEGARHAA